jgi:hypothetical protein
MFMCFGNQTSVINLDLTWKQSFLITSLLLDYESVMFYGRGTLFTDNVFKMTFKYLVELQLSFDLFQISNFGEKIF